MTENEKIIDKEVTHGDVARLSTERVGRLLWEYALPAVVGMAVMSLYNVIDRIFIGQGIHPNAIAGLTVTFPVMNLPRPSACWSEPVRRLAYRYS